MKYGGLIVAGGALAVAGYFVYNATSQPTNQSGDCDYSNWYDYINPVCLLSSGSATVSNSENAATNEINIVLIIVAALIALVIGLLAFGPQTQHLARGASALAVL